MLMSLMFGCSFNADLDPETARHRTDIIIGLESDAESFDPHLVNDDSSARGFCMIYETLVKQDENLDIQPSLAESWQYNGEKELIFNLRKGVKFHNGEELKASDVKFSLDRAASSPGVKSYFKSIESVDILDDYSVSVKLSQPYAELINNLAMTPASIVSEKAVTESGDDFGTNPVGTGPMKLTSWERNSHFILERNDDYWGGTPEATSITFKIMPENSMRNMSLKGGYLDFSYYVQPTNVKANSTNRRLKMESKLMPNVTYIAFNTKNKPFDNVKVRQALSMAADKESMVTVVLEGQGEKANTMLPSDALGADTELELYPYNMENAQRLMAQAGYPDGFSTKIYVSGDDNSRACQILQSDWAKLGVELEIELVEMMKTLDYANSGYSDLCIMTSGVAGNSDLTLYNLFHSMSDPAAGNKSFYSNSGVDALLDKARAEYDSEKRGEIYKQAQRLILEDAPVLPLYTQEKYYGMAKYFEGYILNKNGRHDFSNAYVLEEN